VRASVVLVTCLACLLPVGAVPGYAQVAKLYPVDQAARHPSFLAFRTRLLRAVRARDTTYVLSMVAPNIRNTLGNHGGPAEFRAQWQLASGGERLWSTLREVLERGGTFLGDTMFTAPYTSAAWPAGLDAFEHYVVVARGVRVRSQPATTAQVLAVLSYDIVRSTDGHPSEPAPGWTAVVLADGRRGYVISRSVTSPIGYRAAFARRRNRWYLVSLLAGD
jgi:hypothetical protein